MHLQISVVFTAIVTETQMTCPVPTNASGNVLLFVCLSVHLFVYCL